MSDKHGRPLISYDPTKIVITITAPDDIDTEGFLNVNDWTVRLKSSSVRISHDSFIPGKVAGIYKCQLKYEGEDLFEKPIEILIKVSSLWSVLTVLGWRARASMRISQ